MITKWSVQHVVASYRGNGNLSTLPTQHSSHTPHGAAEPAVAALPAHR